MSSGWTGHSFGIPSGGMHMWTIRSVRGRGEFTDIHIPRPAFHLHIFPTVLEEKVRVINILPILGTKLEGLLLPAFPVWSVNSSEFGYMRYLHSYSAADDAAKESFSGLVLRLESCSIFFFFLYSIQEYAFMVCGLSILVKYKSKCMLLHCSAAIC